MVLKLYGLMTACTQLVYCVLKEKEIPFEVVFVDMVGSAEHKSEAYLEKNPWGQVPYIVRHSESLTFRKTLMIRCAS